MNTTTCLNGKDARIQIILLVALVILSYVVLTIEYREEIIIKQESEVRPDGGFRTASVKTKCYSIPYSREQLKKIEKDGGESKAELTRILLEITQDEDLTQIVAPPKLVFDENSSMVCLDLRDTEVESDPFETRIV